MERVRSEIEKMGGVQVKYHRLEVCEGCKHFWISECPDKPGCVTYHCRIDKWKNTYYQTGVCEYKEPKEVPKFL